MDNRRPALSTVISLSASKSCHVMTYSNPFTKMSQDTLSKHRAQYSRQQSCSHVESTDKRRYKVVVVTRKHGLPAGPAVPVDFIIELGSRLTVCLF